MRFDRLLAPLAVLSLASALGCAVSPPASPVAPASPSASNLAGNWLLSGTFPASLGVGTPVSNPPAITATFDVNGQTVNAAGNFYFACTNGTLGLLLPVPLTGTIRQDGTFTLGDPATSSSGVSSLTVTGTVPSSAGGPWTGTYTASLPTTTLSNCTAAQTTGVISATPIADLTGTYSGSGTATRLPYPIVSGGSLPTTVTVPLGLTASLQQGAPLVTGSTVSSRIGITGSVQVTGISCFTHGTVGTTASGGTLGIGAGAVEGSQTVLPLTMNDGSTAQLLLTTLNTASTRLGVNILQVPSGACAGEYLFALSPLTLVKQ